MKKLVLVGLAAGLASLTACNTTPREQAAENVQANAEAVADNLEDMADNTSGAAADNLNNAADATRAMGDNMAEDVRTHDADTNLANGM